MQIKTAMIPLHTQDGYYQKKKITSVDKDVEKLEPFYTAGGTITW